MLGGCFPFGVGCEVPLLSSVLSPAVGGSAAAPQGLGEHPQPVRTLLRPVPGQQRRGREPPAAAGSLRAGLQLSTVGACLLGLLRGHPSPAASHQPSCSPWETAPQLPLSRTAQHSSLLRCSTDTLSVHTHAQAATGSSPGGTSPGQRLPGAQPPPVALQGRAVATAEPRLVQSTAPCPPRARESTVLL